MRFFILVFIILPALEIGVFLLSGKTIGVWNTVLIIIFTGILGAFLTKGRAWKSCERLKMRFVPAILPVMFY